MVTTDAVGTSTSTFSYDRFGQILNTTNPTVPNNTATSTTNGWVGQHQKITEADLTLKPIQMGVSKK